MSKCMDCPPGQNKVAVVETEVAVSGASTKFGHPA